jgi:hypothetical protein
VGVVRRRWEPPALPVLGHEPMTAWIGWGRWRSVLGRRIYIANMASYVINSEFDFGDS